MNEKGWWWLRAGWLVRGCKDRGCHRQKTLRAPLFSYLPGALSFLFHLLARSYISRCGFEIIFMSRRQRPHRVCTHICACISRIGGVARRYSCLSSPLNYAILRISEIWESFWWIIISRGFSSRLLDDMIFFSPLILLSTPYFVFIQMCIYH